MKTKSYVVIQDAPEMDYMKDFVALPKNYGTPAYFNREDVKAIRDTVYKALDELDKRCRFTEQLRNNRHVLIKPNLVCVYHDSGFDERDYPETTDPRVFEAVVSYIRQYTDRISIVESSGKPIPTPVSFRITGYDRIARFYGAKLVPLEQQPVVRYMLPKAEVMKEVYLPEILDHIPHQEVPKYLNAFTVSVSVSVSESESFGVAVVEAQACGIPVVVSNIGGLPEVVKDGETGFIVPPRNPEATAEAIEKILIDSELKRELSINARNFVLNKYNWNDNIQLIIDIYRKAVQIRGHR